VVQLLGYDLLEPRKVLSSVIAQALNERSCRLTDKISVESSLGDRIGYKKCTFSLNSVCGAVSDSKHVLSGDSVFEF